MADTGNTATIAFATSGFTANYHRIGGTEQERPAIKTSHLGTTNTETYIPGDLIEPGEFEVEFEFDPNNQPPITAVAETVTVTFPTPTGGSAGATLAGTGFVTKWKSADLANNELMVASATVQWDGLTEPTWTDST
jgi:hypothetical protein